MVENYFAERTADGKCAVLFLPADDELIRKARENFVLVFLYEAENNNTKCWFCVRKSAIPEEGKIELGVYERMFGRVVGKGGSNAKKISRALGRRLVTFYRV